MLGKIRLPSDLRLKDKERYFTPDGWRRVLVEKMIYRLQNSTLDYITNLPTGKSTKVTASG